MTLGEETACVVGIGFVGLPLALTLAESGFDVRGVDVADHVVASLRSGIAHFDEPLVQELLSRNLGSRFTVGREIGDRPHSVYVISVGTPVDELTRQPLLGSVSAAAESIGRALRPGNTVVARSTVPVGTSRKVIIPRLETASGLKAGRDFSFAYVPERTVEGNAMWEIRNLPQVVGPLDDASAERARDVFGRINPQLLFLPDLEHAEMLKLVDNTCRDVTFAYANQIALICESLGLDMPAIRRAANCNYPRNNIPLPSPGVGGYCLAKDPYILAALCDRLDIPSSLLRSGREINERIPHHLAQKLIATLVQAGKQPESSKVFVMGCAFKGSPETSDVRFSTTWDFLAALAPRVKEVCVYDAVARDSDLARYGYPRCSINDGFRDADAVVIMNAHRSHAGLPLAELIPTGRSPLVFVDTWAQYDRDTIQSLGAVYGGVGVQWNATG
jgi:UDP-N-acetyl-D-mannosaminuronic acid dehydrogenase